MTNTPTRILSRMLLSSFRRASRFRALLKMRGHLTSFISLTFFVLLYIVHFTSEEQIQDGGNSTRILSRKRRYVVFPEGSSFSIAFCITTRVLTPATDIFTFGLNWGVSYDLPNDTKSFEGSPFANGVGPSPLLLRRHRRDLYRKIEIILDSVGVDGRSCVLRALCEASQRLLPSRGTIVHEMLRVLFTMPMERLLMTEPPEHRIYDWAHRQGHRFEDCPALFASCPISLLDMALNAYT